MNGRLNGWSPKRDKGLPAQPSQRESIISHFYCLLLSITCNFSRWTLLRNKNTRIVNLPPVQQSCRVLAIDVLHGTKTIFYAYLFFFASFQALSLFVRWNIYQTDIVRTRRKLFKAAWPWPGFPPGGTSQRDVNKIVLLHIIITIYNGAFAERGTQNPPVFL